MASAAGGAGSASITSGIIDLSSLDSLILESNVSIYEKGGVLHYKTSAHPMDKVESFVFKDGTTLLDRVQKYSLMGNFIKKGSFGEANRLVIKPGEPDQTIYTLKNILYSGIKSAITELKGLLAVYNLPFCAHLRAAILFGHNAYFLLDYVGGDEYGMWKHKIESQISELSGAKSSVNNERIASLRRIIDSVNSKLIENLARLHTEAGILHRDIKPSNIIITPTNEPVFIDFGLSARIGSENMGQMGHEGYIPPEMRGTKTQTVDLNRAALNATITGKMFPRNVRRPGFGGGRKTKKRLLRNRRRRATRGRYR